MKNGTFVNIAFSGQKVIRHANLSAIRALYLQNDFRNL